MKSFVITLLALFILVAARAQKKEQFSWSKKIMTEVGLSADQQTRVDSIKKASNAEMQPVKDDAALPEAEKKAKLQELQKKRLAAIDAVLTTDQKKKSEEIKARIKSENGGGQ